jgi:agmatine/peptidylarginine deiminase
MKKIFIFLTLAFSLSITASAQEKKLEPWQYGHWLSADEMLRKSESGKNFIETPPPVGPVRNIAEFDKMQGVLIAYPFGIPMELIKEEAKNVMVTTIVLNSTQQATVTSQYQVAGVNLAHCNFLLAPSNSYWTRDYGPWFVSDSSHHIGIIDFPYNRPRPADDEIPKKVAEMLGIPWYGMNVIHTGGNYMTDGMGISTSTVLVWDENPTQTHDSIAKKIHDYLGIDPYLVEPDPNGTYINHIDCWGKYLAPDKILIRKVPPSHPQYAEIESTANFYANTPCSYGYNYRVFRVNTPDDQPYTNSLILNNKVFVPIMNSTWDDSAIDAYRIAMPGYQVFGILGGTATWVSTDALHCRNMGIADIGQLYIHHIPLTGNQPAQDNFLLTADLIPCSDSAVYSDSVLIWYSVNTGNYQKIKMTNTSGLNYAGMIPKQPSGSIIQYYLYAADKSGHNAMMPFMGPADPFTFTAMYTDITAIPDTLWFRTSDDLMNGKATRLHNFTTAGINLDSLQHSGKSGWWVDSLSVAGFPHLMNPGDSEYVHVRFPIPLSGILLGYTTDTMNVYSELGLHRVIIMFNDSLYTGIPRGSGKIPALLVYNYPNPFTGSTVIHYQLPEKTNVRLEVMNTLGKAVAVLVSTEQDAGAYNETFNTANLPSGIYYYRLVTDKETVTKRMLLVR